VGAAHRVSRVIAMFIAILSCLLVGEAKADFTSGNELWDACQANLATEPIKATFCIAYIVGAGETFRALNGGYYCVPDNVPNGQLIEIVKLYLWAHPEKRQDSAPTPITLAFKKNSPATRYGDAGNPSDCPCGVISAIKEAVSLPIGWPSANAPLPSSMDRGSDTWRLQGHRLNSP
jgi:hypothetical protein